MIGAASVVTDTEGRVLLVHHTYGERNWELPGGRGGPAESAEDTARREAREEVGVELEIERLTGVYWEPDQCMHHFVFRARALGEPRAADAAEIGECGWFAADALPRPISDLTVRRIADALAGSPPAVATIAGRTWIR
ncbi:MAG TPA: NUDIX domain-containing protein [Candidatus Limnocylindria bacterium]|nr:NUDIX domain-containing protein [Candidatus Limnocylindria bacterium]